MGEPGPSRIPSKLPLPPQRKVNGIPRPKPGPVSTLQSKRITRRSMSVPDLRQMGAAPTNQKQPATRAPTQRTVQPVNRKRPAVTATATAAPVAKKPLVQSESNKSSAKPASVNKAPPVAAGKRKIAPWDTKGQLDLANNKIERLLQDKENLEALTHDAQAVKDQLDACLKEQALLSSRLEEAQQKRKETEMHLIEAQNQCDSLIADKSALASKIELLKSQLTAEKRKNEQLGEEIQKVECSRDELISVSSQLRKDFEKEKSSNLELCSKLELTETKVKSLTEEVLELQELRRQMHNQILDLKGNIRVFCRVRPPLETESGRAIASFNFSDEASLEIKSSQDPGSAKSSQKTKSDSFTFDKVFSPNNSQDDIYLELSQLVQSALDGYNVCVFAYGQTGSGKTYTMEGGDTQETQGMIPRAIQTIFSAIDKQKQMGWQFSVKCSFLEIYNEVIRDLLNPKSNLPYEIKMVGSDDVMVTNLKVEEVQSAEGLMDLLSKAQKSRFVAATVMNHQSSRSHSIAQIRVESSHAGRNIQCQGTLNLIDLAGSERYNSDNLTDRKKETCNINKSLACLTLVIMHLVEKSGHVPFRDSKLTHLLMPSLKGNSKTLMLVNLAPLEDCYQETLSSLKFATRVSAVELSARRQIKSRMAMKSK